MIARLFAFFTLAFLASASHLEARSQCDTGAINCCNSVQTLDEAGSLLSAFDLLAAATNAGGLVGLTCSPLSVVGGSGCDAYQEPVCCSHNDFNGLVAIGCSPINVGL